MTARESCSTFVLAVSPTQALAMERHLEVCPGCRKVAAAQLSVWNLMGEWEAAPVSPGFDRRLYRPHR